jgi:hypothetical protein
VHEKILTKKIVKARTIRAFSPEDLSPSLISDVQIRPELCSFENAIHIELNVISLANMDVHNVLRAIVHLGK